MNTQLQDLVRLQEIDLRILELQKSKEEFPGEVEKLELAIKSAREAGELLAKKIDEIAVQKRALEAQISQSRQDLTRSEERLNSITTNREYDAVHNEIEAHKHAISNAENRCKTLDQDRERFESEKKAAEESYEKTRSETIPKIEELKQKVASVDADIALVITERDKLFPSINRLFLRTYNHILARRKNKRVISQVSLAEGTCAICHKILEAQLLSEVRRGTRLHICESCGSILIWTAEEEVQGNTDQQPDGGISYPAPEAGEGGGEPQP